MIHFQSIDVGYDSVLFQIAELNLNAGNVYALIGANGAGKTSLINGIIGQAGIKNGALQIQKKLITEYTKNELALQIAYVTSKFDGIEFMSVYEYVSLGRTPHTDIFGRLKKEDKNAIQHALKVMDLMAFEHRQTTQLSDGERQLVSIACALSQQTPIIVLDEPTAFLDYGNRNKLFKLLSRLAHEENKCILFATHDIDLCIEENVNLLIVNQTTNMLELIDNTNAINKKEVVAKGFIQ